MGYSIAVHCRDRKLLDKMVAFMEKNYRGWSKVTGSGGDYSRFASNTYDDSSSLSYDHNKLACGFDFNACEPERDYIFAVTRWMCLMVGAERKFAGGVVAPCFNYDGGCLADDRWPVITGKYPEMVPPRWRFCVVDELGFKPYYHKWVGTPLYEKAVRDGKQAEFFKAHLGFLDEYVPGGAVAIDTLIRDELVRLNKLWGENGER